ncbi:efflux transporter outer membrane subunit [Pseudomonas sp. RIT-PI-AD]|uniref:efflux transporter outer membrane subunit n=1 Tax=Pseudomonas sp. RIT-PI-AD TaxID=3035294 RepID=UPI0021D801C9|nr:efflux transporter outer membrane subunit [Pseudomonas sp. RIT-PI-AD]
MSHRLSRSRLPALLVPLLLAGCVNYSGITPQGRLASADSLQAARALRDVELSPAAWPDGPWWNALGDPAVTALVEEALANSPGLQEVSARVAKANAQVQGANADRYPRIDAQGGVSRARQSRSQNDSGQGQNYATLRSLSFDLAWEPDLWGGRRAAWSAAVSEAHAAEVDYHAARLALTVNVVRAYNRLAQAWRVADLAGRDEQRTAKLLELTEQAHRLGQSDLSLLSSARGLHASARSAQEGAGMEVKVAALQLAALLGKDVDRALDIERPASLAARPLALPSQVPAELLGRRPDIIAARWRVEAASHDIVAIKTRFYPNVDLVASAGVNALSGDNLLGSASRFWGLAPAVSLPIFDADRLRSTLKAGNADYDAMIARYNQTLLDALHEVGLSVTRLQALAMQTRTQQQARDMAQTAFDIAMHRYESGDASYLFTLNIQQQLLQADRQLVELEGQRVDQSIVLIGALGGGFQEDVPQDGSARVR